MNMATELRIVRGSSKLQLLGLVDKAIGVIRAIARPSFVQLVLRIALAVPFWRSRFARSGAHWPACVCEGEHFHSNSEGR